MLGDVGFFIFVLTLHPWPVNSFLFLPTSPLGLCHGDPCCVWSIFLSYQPGVDVLALSPSFFGSHPIFSCSSLASSMWAWTMMCWFCFFVLTQYSSHPYMQVYCEHVPHALLCFICSKPPLQPFQSQHMRIPAYCMCIHV